MSTKPTIFIGSSSQCKHLMDLLYKELYEEFKLERWDKGFFEPSRFPLECLEDKVRTCDYAIFILNSDDMVIGKHSVTAKTRDNVIFEYGLFMGILGRNNVFLLEPNPDCIKVTFPSDFYGITTIRYEYDKDKPDMVGAGIHIKEQIKRLEEEKGNAHKMDVWPLKIAVISGDEACAERLKNSLKKYDSTFMTLNIYDNYADMRKAMDDRQIDCAFVDIFSVHFDEGIDMLFYARDRHREIGFAFYGSQEELYSLTQIGGMRGSTLQHYWKLQKDASDESYQISLEDILIMFYIYKLTNGRFGEMPGGVVTRIFKPDVIGKLNEWKGFI